MAWIHHWPSEARLSAANIAPPAKRIPLSNAGALGAAQEHPGDGGERADCRQLFGVTGADQQQQRDGDAASVALGEARLSRTIASVSNATIIMCCRKSGPM